MSTKEKASRWNNETKLSGFINVCQRNDRAPFVPWRIGPIVYYLGVVQSMRRFSVYARLYNHVDYL